MAGSKRYEDQVFINCPFDDEYKPIFDALVFCGHDSGFVARCALEMNDATENRLSKILGIVSECRFGIHDISRTDPDDAGLPRFNMPLELGLFLGCQRFGGPRDHRKRCLVLDRQKYRFHRFMSDIAGVDVESHAGRARAAVSVTRNWLRVASGRTSIPGGADIWARFRRFRRDPPRICAELRLERDELTFVDLTYVVADRLNVNAT